MVDSGFDKRFAADPVAERLIKRQRSDLGVTPDRFEAVCHCDFVAALHQALSDTLPPPPGEHRQPADFACLLEIDARCADRLVVLESEQVNAMRVAIVHLDFRWYVLLIDEHFETHGADLRFVDSVVRHANHAARGGSGTPAAGTRIALCRDHVSIVAAAVAAGRQPAV